MSILGPLLHERFVRHSQITAIKRKSAVIIDNMCKLVEDPMDAAPFCPEAYCRLLKRAMDEVADPECRNGVYARVQDVAPTPPERNRCGIRRRGSRRVPLLTTMNPWFRRSYNALLVTATGASKDADVAKFVEDPAV